jgi:hypothetical protein
LGFCKCDNFPDSSRVPCTGPIPCSTQFPG